MMIIWTLVLALEYQPYPVITLLMEFKTREACEEKIGTIAVSDEHRKRLLCMSIAHEGI